MAQMIQNWLVAVDDTTCASWAFSYATTFMDKQIGHLFILNVHEEPKSIYGSYASPELLNRLSEVEDAIAEKILVHYGQKAQQIGIKYTMIKGISSNVGEFICQAIKRCNIQHVVTGRRDMGDIKRIFMGSTSKYIMENAQCTVIIVKNPFGDEEESAYIQKIIQAENAERTLRIEEIEAGKRIPLPERFMEGAKEAKERLTEGANVVVEESQHFLEEAKHAKDRATEEAILAKEVIADETKRVFEEAKEAKDRMIDKLIEIFAFDDAEQKKLAYDTVVSPNSGKHKKLSIDTVVYPPGNHKKLEVDTIVYPPESNQK